MELIVTNEADTRWMQCIGKLVDSDEMPDSIGCRKNFDGTLDYRPVPLAMKYLFKDGGEKNEVC